MTTTHRITTTAAVILSLAAAAAPAATARPAGADPASWAATATPAAVYSRPDKSMVAGSQSSPTAFIAKTSAPQAAVQIQTPQSGFDWGDASIGAAGGLALAMLGVGGGLAISRRRPRSSRETTALPGSPAR